MKSVRYLYLVIVYGMMVGVWAGIAFVFIFPQIIVFTRVIPSSAIPLIFFRNSFAVTLISLGGVANCLVEVRIWRNKKLSRRLNRSVDPLYFLIKRFSNTYEKLGRFYRSLHLGLFAFPVLSIFVIIFIASFYFTIFILKLGVDGFFIVVKSIPYALLEISVYFYGAYLALEIANNLDPYVKEKNLKLFVRESKKSIKDKRVWKILLVLYLLLFISAVLEQFFTSL